MRDEDIFRKLNKQKPLVKSKEIEPLSSQDFMPRRRGSVEAPVSEGLQTRPVRVERKAYRDDDDSLYERPSERQKSYNLEDKNDRRSERDESVLYYGDEEPVKKQKPVKKSEPDKLDVFSENVKSKPVQKVVRDEPVYEPSEEIDLSAGESKKPVQFRHELKYYINYRDYAMLRGMLRGLMRQDRFAGEDGSYFIRSLYFDDVYESSLVEKISGNDYRHKYRIRAYNYSDDNIRFEKKYKYGQYIAKTSIQLSRDEYESIMNREYDFLKDRREDLAKELYIQMTNNMLRPRVIVDYDREAYVFPIEECRITFDKDIRGGLMVRDIFDTDVPVMPMLESGLMVLEIKFFKYLPEFIKRIINNLNAADRSAISKYVICRKYE